MNPEYTVRKMGASDFLQIAEIQQLVLPEDLVTRLGARVLVEVVYPNLMSNNSQSMVIETGGRIAGFAFLAAKSNFLRTLVIEAPTQLISVSIRSPLRAVMTLVSHLSAPKIKYDYELLWVCVSSDHQSKGYGKELIRAVLIGENSERGHIVIVRTLTSTPRNVSFYQSLGFKVTKKQFGRVWLVCNTSEGKRSR